MRSRLSGREKSLSNMCKDGAGWDLQFTIFIAIPSALLRCRRSGALAGTARSVFLLQRGMFIHLSTQLGCRWYAICLLILIVVAKCKWSCFWCIRSLIAISDFLSWSQSLPKPQCWGDHLRSGRITQEPGWGAGCLFYDGTFIIKLDCQRVSLKSRREEKELKKKKNAERKLESN